jgi:hypothetical protein
MPRDYRGGPTFSPVDHQPTAEWRISATDGSVIFSHGEILVGVDTFPFRDFVGKLDP